MNDRNGRKSRLIRRPAGGMNELKVPYGRRCWAEVDLDQIVRNYRLYAESMKIRREIMCVVKANAYGHGDVPVALALEKAGCGRFAVSNIEEAVRLRSGGIRGEILILGYTPVSEAGLLSANRITQTLTDEGYAQALAAAAEGGIRCHWALDTGMRRIGLNADDPEAAAEAILRTPAPLTVTGLFTHLCAADTPWDDESADFTRAQQEKALQVFSLLRAAGRKDLVFHGLNSAGGLFYPEDRSAFSRLGIILYGLKPDRGNDLPDGIRPALSLKCAVSMVKDIHPGDSVGYGRTFRAEREMRVATLPVGYADGFSRALSGKGHVLIRGARAPILGRVCMDQTMVDVSNIPGVAREDEAVILGRSGALEQTADDLAEQLGTIGYEIVCGISPRVRRVYLGNGTAEQ